MPFKHYSSQMFKQWKSTYLNMNDLQQIADPASLLSRQDYQEAIHSYPRPFKINLDELACQLFLKDTLSQAIEHQHLLISDQTLLLYDLSQHPSTPFQSLLFQLNKRPIKSQESTRSVMERFFKLNQCPMSWSKLLANSLGYKQRVPYLFGGQIFLPDRGTSKQNAYWLALHNVRYVDYDSGRRKTYIYGHYNNKVCLTGDKQTFEEHLSRCANIYRIQKEMAKDLISQWQGCEFIKTSRPSNIVEHYLSREEFAPIEFSFCDFITYLIYNEAQSIIKDITKEDNPFIEDFQKQFKLTKKEF